MPRNLDLALIGNGAIGLLVDRDGRDRLGLLSALRRRRRRSARCSTTRRRARTRGIYASSSSTARAPSSRTCTNTAVLVTRLYDRAGGAIEITDCVPRFLQHGRMFHPMTLVRTHPARRRQPAHRRPAAARRATTAARVRHVTVGQQPHPLRHARTSTLRLTTDASLTAILEERPFFLDDAVTLLLGPDETVPSAVGEVGRRFIEETIALLARLGAPARDPVRMAGRGDPRGDHAAAERLRRHRRDRRRDDDVDSRGRRSRPQLGLPLLLAARRLFRRRRAEPAGRDRDDGALPRLHRRHRRRRAATGRCSRSTASTATPRSTSEIVDVAARLSRHGAGAGRQRRLPAGAARRLRLGGPRGHARVLRRAAGRSAATPRCSSGSKPSAGGRSRCYDQPDAGLWELRGSMRVHTFSSVMCWAACDRLARIAARLGLAERARGVAQPTPSASARFVDERCWSEARRASSRTADGDDAGREPAAARRPRLPRARTIRASPRPCARSSAS